MTPEKLAATLLSSFPDLVFLLAPDDTFLAYHTPDERQLSLAPEQFLGKEARAVLPELWGKLAPLVAEVRSTGALRTLRYRTQTPAGESPFEARILPAEGGNVLLLVREVSELQQTEARAQRQITLLEELQQIHVISTGGGEAREVFEKLLGVVLRATDSSFGFFGEFSEVDDEPQLRTRAITDISWDEASSRTYQRLAPEGMVFRNMDSLFGAALTTGKPVIANNPANDPRRGGLPPGHPPLRSFLGMPFFRGEKLLGMIGLANRPGGYPEDLLALLAPFLESCAHLSLFYQSEEARKAAETGRLLARREAERFQRLFELSNVNVAVISVDGTLLDANPAYLRTLGWGKDDIFGMDAMSLLHPDDLPRATEYFRKIFEGEEARGLEARHRHRDGSYRWLLSNGIRDPEQSLFYGVSLDITARKEGERRSEEQLRLLEMSEALSGVGHWHVDLVSKQVRWSPEVCRIHGVDPSFSPSLEEATAFYHPDDRASVQAHIEDAIHEKRAFTLELRLKRTDGKERLVMSSGRPEEDPAGRVVSIFGVFQDITERKQADLELYKLATVANRTHNAVVIADALGVIEWVNEGFERLTGYALSDCVGRTPGSFLQGPGSDPQVIAHMRNQIRNWGRASGRR
jgi:PAS domain S-box-containing protein